ncbi:hypothetical protein, partial, partial [Parasitella parasitica]
MKNETLSMTNLSSHTKKPLSNEIFCDKQPITVPLQEEVEEEDGIPMQFQQPQKQPQRLPQQQFKSERGLQPPVTLLQSVQPLPLLHPTINYSIPTDGIQPGGRLQQFIQQWRAITNHPWPLSVIQNGYKIQFAKKPIPWKNARRPTTREDQIHINVAVQKFLDGGVIEISPLQNRNFLSKFFTLQEKTKRHPILDCQILNNFIQVEHFKMEGVPTLRQLMEPDEFMCKLDLRDAYVVVPIHKDS